jgi:uncharacterized protein YuzE
MDVRYDLQADAVYLTMGSGTVDHTVEFQDRMNLDLDSTGEIVGIEILEASHQKSLVSNLKSSAMKGIPIDIINATPVLA